MHTQIPEVVYLNEKGMRRTPKGICVIVKEKNKYLTIKAVKKEKKNTASKNTHT